MVHARRRTIDLGWGTVSCLEWEPEETVTSGATATTASATARDPLPVLLLHGGGVDNAWLSWGELGGALAARGHRVYAPDNPGHGESDRAPWPFTQERLVTYVGEVVDALGLDRYVVGGLSLGGGLSIGHVLDRPSRVAGAMLLGTYGIMRRQYPGPLALPAHVFTWMTVATGFMGWMLRWYGNDQRRLGQGLVAIVRDPQRRTPELVDAVQAEAQRESAFVPFEQWQRDQIGPLRLTTDYSDRLSQFPVPALVVHGDRDTGVPVARAEAAAGSIPDSRLLVVTGAGHWVQRDRPDVVAPAVLGFLDAVG
jgi:pimeloyl-ACP methyl ester carboxylesterase